VWTTFTDTLHFRDGGAYTRAPGRFSRVLDNLVTPIVRDAGLTIKSKSNRVDKRGGGARRGVFTIFNEYVICSSDTGSTNWNLITANSPGLSQTSSGFRDILREQIQGPSRPHDPTLLGSGSSSMQGPTQPSSGDFGFGKKKKPSGLKQLQKAAKKRNIRITRDVRGKRVHLTVKELRKKLK
jgi:hypothetical protein